MRMLGDRVGRRLLFALLYLRNLELCGFIYFFFNKKLKIILFKKMEEMERVLLFDDCLVAL